jgi:peroxin-3
MNLRIFILSLNITFLSYVLRNLNPLLMIRIENHDDDNPDQAYGNDFETNRKYLNFSWWLLHRGWKEVMLKVEAAVKEIFGALSIRDDISMQRFSELTLEVRKKVEGATEEERKEGKWL